MIMFLCVTKWSSVYYIVAVIKLLEDMCSINSEKYQKITEFDVRVT